MAEGNDWTPLRLAAAAGHFNVTGLLLRHGANCVSYQGDGWGVLAQAACAGHTKICELLLNHGANIEEGEESRTPLQLAVDHNHIGLAKLLLERGANCVTHDDEEWGVLSYAAYHGHAEICKLLLDHGALIKDDEELRTPLLRAARWNRLDAFKVLLEYGANIFPPSRHGLGATHVAAGEGYVQLCELLLENSADFRRQDGSGQTCVHRAAAGGHLGVLHFLARIDGIDFSCADKFGRTALFHAAMHGQTETVRALICPDAPPDGAVPYTAIPYTGWIQEDIFGITPVLSAAINGHKNVLRLLLDEEGWKIDQKDGFGRTLLWAARKSRQADTVEMMRDYADTAEMIRDYAEQNSIRLQDCDATIEESGLIIDPGCINCGRHSLAVPKTASLVSNACHVCDAGFFAVCLECNDISAWCQSHIR